VLTDPEAHTLLTAALGDARTPADARGAVTELIALCGGFPLALGLIAARIRTHPALLDDIVTDLRELGLDALASDDPDTSLPAVLSWSLRHLTERQRSTFALLGTAPGPDIDLPAAARLTGLPTREARTVLRGLADASLIDPAPGDRYAMHDLVRVYAATTARDHLSEAVRRAALERVVDSYLYTAHASARLLDPHRVTQIRLDHTAALAWLDTHHPHLLAAQHIAATHGRHHAVWHLAWTLYTFHNRRGHRHDELAVWQAAADAASHLPEPAARTLAHRYLGTAHAELGQHEQAIGRLHQALASAREHHDPTEQANTHSALAWTWARWGDHRKAVEHARHALDLFRILDQPVWEARALNAVGWHAAHVGDYDTARDHCRQALALHRQHHNPDGEAETLDSLGYIDHHTGHHHQAIHHYRQALALFRALGNTTETANTLDKLGHPHAALGHHTQARAVWEEALGLYRKQGRSAAEVRVRQQLGDLDTLDRTAG
jgi:tetratricopeptide (TPR) repeat protein